MDIMGGGMHAGLTSVERGCFPATSHCRRGLLSPHLGSGDERPDRPGGGGKVMHLIGKPLELCIFFIRALFLEEEGADSFAKLSRRRLGILKTRACRNSEGVCVSASELISKVVCIRGSV